MGNYNPHAPIILGNEWVPLRGPGFKPDNVTEVGTTVRIDNATTVVTGYYYVRDNVPNTYNAAVELVSVYPAGQEDDTGPVQQIIIPASTIGISGNGISGTVAGLQNSADSATVAFIMGDPAPQNLGISFDVASAQGALQGKRILNVELLLTASGTPENTTTIPGANSVTIGVIPLVGSNPQQFISGALNAAPNISLVTDYSVFPLGDVNLFWTPGTVVSTDPKAFPWRWEELNNFSTVPIPGNRIIVRISYFNPNGTGVVNIGYAALRVTFCEERRVLYGGDSVHANMGFNNFAPGPRPVQLLTPQFTAPGALPAGDYTITLSHRLYGDSSAYQFSRTAPRMYGIAEYRSCASQRGRLVRQTFTPGSSFTVEDTNFLPQLTLHTSTGVVTGSHSYGSVIPVPVYGTITAAQVLTNLGVAGNTYPWVRFYARNFGATNSLQVSNGTSTASITPAAFAALPEIADGWKEVTLQFGVSPTGANINGTWTFSAAGEIAGLRWEILGVNGVSPNSPQNIGPSTYQAPSGSTQQLTWSSPSITGLAADSTSDVVLFMSQSPPNVAGFAVAQNTLNLTVVGDCSVPNASLPRGIYFNRLTWSPPVTGMQLEIQRMDAYDNTWQTVALYATPTLVSSFDDYEARVGVLSSYRARYINDLGFVGAWSATITATLTAPGVLVGDGTGVLIFTSNQSVNASLAYPMSWNDQPIETFVFPEAGEQTFQRMYGRDYQVAFRPLERGGEQFQRTLVLQSAAVTPTRLADMKSLRDLAWADLPYVCVRDELGNRWYANVLAAGGSVQNKRRIYLVQIQVTEVTGTPAPVGS